MLARQRYRLSPAAEQTFREYLSRRMTQPRFANARSVRNALERARLRHANRLAAGAGPLGRERPRPPRAGGFPRQPGIQRLSSRASQSFRAARAACDTCAAG